MRIFYRSPPSERNTCFENKGSFHVERMKSHDFAAEKKYKLFARADNNSTNSGMNNSNVQILQITHYDFQLSCNSGRYTSAFKLRL